MDWYRPQTRLPENTEKNIQEIRLLFLVFLNPDLWLGFFVFKVYKSIENSGSRGPFFF